MALAINGGDWDADYTEAQKRGWQLKADYCNTRTALSQAAVGATVRACAEIARGCAMTTSSECHDAADAILTLIDQPSALEDVKKQAFNEGIEAAMDAILHDHNKPEDNRTWVGERPYVCEENSYHAIRALKKDENDG